MNQLIPKHQRGQASVVYAGELMRSGEGQGRVSGGTRNEIRDWIDLG